MIKICISVLALIVLSLSVPAAAHSVTDCGTNIINACSGSGPIGQFTTDGPQDLNRENDDDNGRVDDEPSAPDPAPDPEPSPPDPPEREPDPEPDPPEPEPEPDPPEPDPEPEPDPPEPEPEPDPEPPEQCTHLILP